MSIIHSYKQQQLLCWLVIGNASKKKKLAVVSILFVCICMYDDFVATGYKEIDRASSETTASRAMTPPLLWVGPHNSTSQP